MEDPKIKRIKYIAKSGNCRAVRFSTCEKCLIQKECSYIADNLSTEDFNDELANAARRFLVLNKWQGINKTDVKGDQS